MSHPHQSLWISIASAESLICYLLTISCTWIRNSLGVGGLVSAVSYDYPLTDIYQYHQPIVRLDPLLRLDSELSSHNYTHKFQ